MKLALILTAILAALLLAPLAALSAAQVTAGKFGLTMECEKGWLGVAELQCIGRNRSIQYEKNNIMNRLLSPTIAALLLASLAALQAADVANLRCEYLAIRSASTW